MLKASNLLYFENFQFPNLKEPLRNKYLLVIDNDQNHLVFLAFTTTKWKHQVDHNLFKPGCISQTGVHSFKFDYAKIVCDDTKFVFPEQTFLNVKEGQVFDMNAGSAHEHYIAQNSVDYKGKLSEGLFVDILSCISTSPFIAEKYTQLAYEVGNRIVTEAQLREKEAAELKK